MSSKKEQLTISSLKHTWIIDLDGTLVEHNGYKTGTDQLLPGAKTFMQNIPADDYILIMTAREKSAKNKTEKFLLDNGIRYDMILFEMPMGERILINDKKTSGLCCSYAISPDRNHGLKELEIFIDKNL